MHLRPAVAAFAVAALLLACPPARGADPRMDVSPAKGPPTVTVDKTNEPGVLSGSLTETMDARVRSVDLAKRQVTLHAGDRVETMTIGPEVKSLEKLERSDRVSIRARAGLVLRPRAAGEPDAAPEVSKERKNTSMGDELSGTEIVRARITMKVTAVDPGTRILTMAGSDQRTYSVKAGPGVALDAIKVGDGFNATWSAAMAVSVDPVYRE
jgi:hypothetical protein